MATFSDFNWIFPGVTVKGNKIIFSNWTKKDMCRLKYLGLKQGRSIRGIIIQALYAYIRSNQNEKKV